MTWKLIEMSDGIAYYVDEYYDFKCSIDIEGWEKYETDDDADESVELAVATAYVKDGEKPRIEVVIMEQYAIELELNFMFQKAKREALDILEEEIKSFIEEYCV